MGKATIINMSPNSVTVDLHRDLTKINAEKLKIEQSQLTMSSQISLLNAQVTQTKINVDYDQNQLDIAISSDTLNQNILDLQQRLIVSTSELVSVKSSRNTVNYQLANLQKRLSAINDELDRDMVITIPKSDSGFGLSSGQIIGVAEISRGSNFIALPSKRDGGITNTALYDAERDGITLPKLAEEPYGWWYNTMIEPSAQVWKPRYWLGTILLKDDVTNRATVYIKPSENFTLRPFNQNVFIHLNVPFEYEPPLNSLAFITGDLALVEFNSSGDPIIIGFGSDEKLSRGVIATHKKIFGGGSVSFNLISPWHYLSDPDPLEINRSFSAFTRTPDVDKNKVSNTLHGWSHDNIMTTLGQGRTPTTYPPFALREKLVTVYLSFTGEDTTVTNFTNTTRLYPVISQGGARLRYTTMRHHYVFQPGTDNLPFYSLFPNAQFQITPTQIENKWDYNLTLGMGWIASGYEFSDSTFVDWGSFTLRSVPDPAQEIPAELSMMDKLDNLGSGLHVPTDWLWPDDNYVQPVKENQFLYIREAWPSDPGNPNEDIFTLAKVNPFTAYGTPPNYTTIQQEPTNGTQNLIPWSEDLQSNQHSVADAQVVLTDLVSPVNTDVKSYKIQSINADTDFQRPFFRISEVDVFPNTQYTLSFYVRRDSLCIISVNVHNFVRFVLFDLIDVTADIGTYPADIGTYPADDTGIIKMNEDWFRCYITFTTLSFTDEIFFYLEGMGIKEDFNGINGFCLTGLQLTEGAGFQTYVKTDGTPIL